MLSGDIPATPEQPHNTSSFTDMAITKLSDMKPKAASLTSLSSTPFLSSSTTRTVPPPIDLGRAGSNIMRASTLQEERRNGMEIVRNLGCHPYARDSSYDCAVNLRHLEAGTPSTSTFGPESLSSFTQERTDLELVPNRRRRSYSAGRYSFTPPTSAKSLQSTFTTGSEFPDYPWPSHSLRTPSSSSTSSSLSTLNTPKSASSSFSFNNKVGDSPSWKSSLTSPFEAFGLRQRLLSKEKVHVVEEEGEDNECSRVQDKLKMFVQLQLPFHVGTGDSRDEANIKTSRKKTWRPGTSPLTPLPVSDEWSSGCKKKERPLTANSTPTSTTTPASPRRISKLDWQWQWKRWSLLRSSSSNSSSTSSSPRSSSLSSTSSMTTTLNAMTMQEPTTKKSNAIPTPPHSASPVPQPSANITPKTSESRLKVPGSADRCISRTHRSTPNLQVPAELSMEDRGKINAFYAPPPTMHLQVLTRTPPGSPKSSKSSLGEPNTTIVVPNVTVHAPSQIGVPCRLSKPKSMPHELNMKESRIALPLSPVSDEGWRAREDEGTIFLTMEDESEGEAVLRLVESPM